MPRDRRRSTDKHSARRAAQMRLRAAFAPLRGFPVPGERRPIWCVMPDSGLAPPTLRPLTADWLAEAHKAVLALPARFPRVLRERVGDTEPWQRGSAATLGVLRDALSGKFPVPSLPPSVPAAAVAGLPPPIASALAWTFAFDPRGLDETLRMSAEIAAAARAAGARLDALAARARFLVWVELLAPMGRRASALWTLWAAPDAWTTPIAPSTGARDGVADWVFNALPKVAALSSAARRALVELIGTVATPAIPARLVALRDESPVATRARTSRRRPAIGDQAVTDWNRILDRCARLPVATLTAMADALRHAPEVIEGRIARLELAAAWSGAEVTEPLRGWLEALAKYLRSAPDPDLALWAWRPFLRGRGRGMWSWSPCELWLAAAADRRQARPGHCFAVLRRLCDPHLIQLRRRDRNPFTYLHAICAHVADPDAAADYAKALLVEFRALATPREVFCAPLGKLVPCALRLAGGDVRRFARVVVRLAHDEALVDLCCRDGWGATPSLPPDAGWVGDLLCAGSGADAAAVRTLLDRSMRGPIPTNVFDAADASLRADIASVDWPTAVSPQLQGLASRSPALHRAAQALRGELLPESAATRTELAAVERLLVSATEPRRSHLAHRRDTLRERLDAGFMPRRAVVDRWLHRVARKADRLRLAAWTEALSLPVRSACEQALAFLPPIVWWQDQAWAGLLPDLAALPREFARLAGRILAARDRGVWQGHLDDPRNEAWLAAQQAAGLDVDAWRRGPTPFALDDPRFADATFAIAADPRDVLQCGAWFVTCLAPGAMNFFSTVVIAADANKHVLVLRNAAGDVHGRCVFAIDCQRRLRAFEPYCHDPSLDFAAIVERIGRDWAKAIGAGWPGAAPVDALTASRWYDDGNARLSDQMHAILGEPGVEARLHAGPDTALVDLLRERLGNEVLQSGAAQFALSSRCVEACPRLAGPLLALCALPSHMDSWTLELALAAAVASGHRNAIARLVERASGANLVGPALGRAWLHLGNPARALRALRPRRRRFREDRFQHGDRLVVSAQAHEQLFRRRRALEMYEAAIRSFAPASEAYAAACAHRDRLVADLGRS